MRGRSAAGVASLTVLVASAAVQAAPLNLTLLTPDIASGFLSVGYDAGSDLLTVSGWALTLDLDGESPPDHNITSGSFAISVSVDSNGAITPGVGTLTIGGYVLSAGPTLLTGDIIAFGYPDEGGEIFEFLFKVTGGDLADDFGCLSGVILDAMNTGFTGSFDNNFSNSGLGVSDTGAFIPEAGDLDADGDVDLADYAAFADCLSGPCASAPCEPPLYSDPCCAPADADSDGDVDLEDYAAFQVVFTG